MPLMPLCDALEVVLACDRDIESSGDQRDGDHKEVGSRSDRSHLSTRMLTNP